MLYFHEKVCKNNEYCQIVFPEEENILKYNHGQKSIRPPFLIHADMESIHEKINSRENNPEKNLYDDRK